MDTSKEGFKQWLEQKDDDGSAGTRGNTRECAFAKYLISQGATQVKVCGDRLGYITPYNADICGRWIVGETPTWLRHFILHFDRGAHGEVATASFALRCLFEAEAAIDRNEEFMAKLAATQNSWKASDYTVVVEQMQNAMKNLCLV